MLRLLASCTGYLVGRSLGLHTKVIHLTQAFRILHIHRLSRSPRSRLRHDSAGWLGNPPRRLGLLGRRCLSPELSEGPCLPSADLAVRRPVLPPRTSGVAAFLLVDPRHLRVPPVLPSPVRLLLGRCFAAPATTSR